MFFDILHKQELRKSICGWIIIGTIIALGIGVCLLGTTYKKRPIVSSMSCQIISVETYDLQLDKQISVADAMYDDEAVLRILNHFDEKRTLVRDNGFKCSEVVLRIVLLDNNRGIRDIRFGEQNYSCAERGSNRYVILQPTELLAELYNEIPVYQQ